MKRILTSVLMLLAVIIANPLVYSQQAQLSNGKISRVDDKNSINRAIDRNPETDTLLQIAARQIHSFIDSIPVADLGDYGFNNKEEFKRIAFDHPVKMYVLKDTNLVFISTWRIPVVVDNVYRCLLTAVKENNEYKIVDFGARLLAQELFSKKTDQTAGLLRVYELHSDFIIETGTGNKLSFTPVKSSQGKSLRLVDILNMIKND